MNPVILKRFDAPDELRSFEKGTLALVHLGGMTIGQATYEPGWKWSEHVGPLIRLKLALLSLRHPKAQRQRRDHLCYWAGK
jgi:hypothetical protein